MGVPREPTYSLLTVACFSRHPQALDWATERLRAQFGDVALISPDFSFHHTKYYEQTMGAELSKRFVVFDTIVPAGCLPKVKRFTITLEAEMAESRQYSESRPLNIDPGLIQLGKFVLASTKDQAHRLFLDDDIFGEVTLRFTGGAFEPWPWTYADYREEAVLSFLNEARAVLYAKVSDLRSK